MSERVSQFPRSNTALHSEFPVNFIEKPLQEKCGIMAFWTPRPSPKLETIVLGMGGVQHRGQDGAGFATFNRTGIHHGYGSGKVESSLEHIGHKVVIELSSPSFWTMGHCRYTTQGDQHSENLQPCVETTPQGETVAVAHNGEFVFTHPLDPLLTMNGNGGISDTRIFTRMLARAEGKTNAEKILNALDSGASGAYSLVIAMGEEMYVIRDPRGIRPFFYAKHEDGTMVASETIALGIAGAESFDEIPPGILFQLTERGLKEMGKSKEKIEGAREHFCIFEIAYFSRPDSLYKINGEWRSVGEMREAHGKILAQEHPVPHADFIIGIPDSGKYAAAGYAEQMLVDGYRVPLKEMIVRDHFHQKHGEKRSFQADLDIDRAAVIAGKTSAIQDRRWEGASVGVVDDSDVRGKNAKKQAEVLQRSGVIRQDWRFAYPRVISPCHLGINMKTLEELIAARNDSDDEKIAKELNVDSVRHISDEGFVRGIFGDSIKIPDDPLEIFLENDGCGGCLTGIYPVDQQGNIWQPKAAASIS